MGLVNAMGRIPFYRIMAKESFIIYKEFYPAIEHLSDAQLGRLFRSIFEYHRNGSDCEDSEIKMAFMFFKNQFRLDEEKYQKVIDRNRKNGLSGGRPKDNEETQTNPNNPVGFQEPKKPYNDNDKDNVKENDNENEKELKRSLFSLESKKFAEWFSKELKPESMNPTEKDLESWAKTYDKLKKDGKTKEQIVAATKWARNDDFWAKNFQNPNKLRKKNKDEVFYIDVFLDQMKIQQIKKEENPPANVYVMKKDRNPRTGQ